jgi:septation ring formation regulator EzrA
MELPMSAGGPVEVTLIAKVLEWAWLAVCALIGIVWKKHNEEMDRIDKKLDKVDENMNAHAKYLDGRIDSVERNSVPYERYEQNRKEVREGQVETFKRLDSIGHALARIEGKLEK